MGNRAHDWLRQALRDLEQAQASRREGRHEWACFAAHQAAEKAGSVGPLGDLPDRGRVLDNFYVPSRYRNGHPEGAPFEHYGPIQSDEALRHAGEILAFVRARLA
jgi:HEPN domain-containing protein